MKANKRKNPELILSGAVNALFKTSISRLNLSARQCQSILDVSVTIAKLGGAKEVMPEHIAEAIQYQDYDI